GTARTSSTPGAQRARISPSGGGRMSVWARTWRARRSPRRSKRSSRGSRTCASTPMPSRPGSSASTSAAPPPYRSSGTQRDDFRAARDAWTPRRRGAGRVNIQIGFVAGAALEEVSAMEQLPIDSLWTGGHIASRNPSPEAMMNLARLSAVTERVAVGTSILLLPLYEPAIVAKQIADIDRATGGRVILGVGVGGEYPEEFRACRVPINERGRPGDEAMGLPRKLWTAEAITHHGRYYAMDDVRVHPAPAQIGGPPILVAGRSEPAMRRAAQLGDGWMPYLYSPRRY